MPAPRDITVLGRRIRYWDEGAGAPLLLVHGFSGSAAFEWGRVFDELSQHLRVIALQVVGFAPSEQPNIAYTTDALVEHLGAFMRALDLHDITLLGESFGGWLVAEYAARCATLKQPPIARLALVGAAVCVKRLPKADARGFVDADVQAEADAYAATQLYNNDPTRAAIVRDSDLAKGTMNAAKLSAIKVPTLLLWGDKDELIPLDCGHDAAQAIPNSRLIVLPNIGHIPSIEAPAEFIRFVSEFARG
jgi:pimeloyl-ACP methyl ester carboxylesterase